MSGRKNFPPEIDIYEILDHANNKEWGSDDEENYTALASAIYLGNSVVLRFVLSNEPHQLEILSDGKSPTYLACDLGQLECLKILLSCGANTESRYTRTGGTALYVAAEKGQLECVRELLNRGANINAKDKTGVTPVFVACQNNHINVLKLLIQSGASLDDMGFDGMNPIAAAISRRHVDVVRMLIEQRVDLNCGSLVIASQFGYFEIVHLLVSNGANVDQIWYGHSSKSSFDTPNFLATVDWSTRKPVTSLYSATIMSHLDVVKYLLQQKARVDLPENDFLLHLACGNGEVEIVRELLRYGAGIQAFDSRFMTPLAVAISREKILVVKELLSLGANIEIGTINDSISPLCLSVLTGNKEIALLLLNKSAKMSTYEIWKVKESIIDDEVTETKKQMIGEVLEMIEDERRHQMRRAHFDSFINRFIESKKFVKLIYSTCFPSEEAQVVSSPEIGWPKADSIVIKYYFDEIFFYVHLFVAQVLRESQNKQSCDIKNFFSNENDKCSTLMTILTTHMFSYLKPFAVNLCPHCSQKGKFRCSRCKCVFFCSSACQKKDWSNHKLICKVQK